MEKNQGLTSSRSKYGMRQWYKMILAICALIIIISLGAYCFSPAKDSDFAEDAIWAEAMLQAGRVLNPDFAYPYAIPFGGNIFVFPFVALFGVGQLANSCGMFLFYLCFIITTAFFCGSFCKKPLGVLIGTAIIALSLRSGVGQNQLHHILYYQLGNICLIGSLAMSIWFIFHQPKKRYLFGLAFYSLWSGANGIVTIILATLPTLAALLFLLIVRMDDRKKTGRCLLCVICAAVGGYLIYRFSMRGIQEGGYISGVGTYTFQSISTWFSSLRQLPEDWFSLFVLYGPEGRNIKTPGGLETAFSIMYGVAVAALPIYIVAEAKKEKKDYREAAVLVSAVFVWCICLAQYVFFRKETRILYNGVLIQFAIIASWVLENENLKNWGNTDTNRIRSGIMKTASLAVAVILSVYTVCFTAKATWQLSTELTDTLYDQGLTYGFSTFWNANYNTVNSSNKVKIRLIQIIENSVRPQLFQSNRNWYDQNSIGSDDWFLLLSDADVNYMNNFGTGLVFEKCKYQMRTCDYNVYVFDADDWNAVLLGN